MGILKKRKYQTGGVFGGFDKYELGADDFTGLFKTSGPSTAGGSYQGLKSTGSSSGKTESSNLSGALQSDIQYYTQRKDEIKESIKEGLDRDPDGFDDTAEYESLTRELYSLEKEFLPQMKSMAKLYSTSKTNFMKRNAGDAPAILNGQALVRDVATNEYKLVDEYDLVRNAKQYQLLTAADAATKRQTDSEFSGFTDLGKFATQVMDNAFGQESFDKFLKSRISSMGYVKRNDGKFANAEGDVLDLGGVEYGPDGGMQIKTNSPQILNLISDISNNKGSKATNYSESIATRDLYNKAKNSSVDLTELPDQDIYQLLEQNKTQALVNQLKTSLIVDQGKGGGSGDGSTGSLAFKPVKRNVVSNALVTMDRGRQRMEVDDAIKKEDEGAGSLLYSMPAGKVYNGDQLLNAGYKSAYSPYSKESEEEELINPQLRTLENNSFINNLSENGVVTTVDGKPVMSLVEEGDGKYITTPENSSLYFMIAPIETDASGKEYVNFDNKYSKQVKEATQVVQDYLEKNGVTAEDIALGRDREKMQRVLAEANAEAAKVLGDKYGKTPPNLRLGVAASFDVIYETKRSTKKYKYSKEASQSEKAFLNKITPDTWERFVRKTKAFVPVGQSFWVNSAASDAFGNKFERTFTYNDWMGIMQSSPTTSEEINPSSIISSEQQRKENEKRKVKVENKKRGGKLVPLSSDLEHLLNKK